ncbi:hypothetical protein F2Q68_00014890 [Brassica cretica]|uniref:Uncharacterized protein n=1 Tax=Brassica cretica TaxID=69181 RepID=A0A8S9H9P1_BRACR|nr:hypothetical protein F2Q68_00014890 [Brassica cretica]
MREREFFRWLALDRGYIKSHSVSLDDPSNPSQFQKCRLPSREGNVLYCKLPQPHLTNFSTIENICFLPDLEFMCADPRATPPDDDMDDVEDITPDEDAAYNLGALDDDALT